MSIKKTFSFFDFLIVCCCVCCSKKPRASVYFSFLITIIVWFCVFWFSLTFGEKNIKKKNWELYFHEKLVFTTFEKQIEFSLNSMCSSLVWLGVLFNTDLFIVSLFFTRGKYYTKIRKNKEWKLNTWCFVKFEFLVINYLLSLNNLLKTFISLERLWKKNLKEIHQM